MELLLQGKIPDQCCQIRTVVLVCNLFVFWCQTGSKSSSRTGTEPDPHGRRERGISGRVAVPHRYFKKKAREENPNAQSEREKEKSSRKGNEVGSSEAVKKEAEEK